MVKQKGGKPGGGARQPQGPTSKLPRKKFYRARAHSNPLSDHSFDVPDNPDVVDWPQLFPALVPSAGHPAGPVTTSSSGVLPPQEDAAVVGQPVVRFADIGCGFGGLLIQLAPKYPDTLMVGMELRLKVSHYVRERIISLRAQHPGEYQNCACIRTNAMRYLPHYFHKGQLTKMFFLFPDPHFKVANHRRRIINTPLLTEYAYLMAPGGWLYTITDVQELGEWMKAKLDGHPMFERVSEEELAQDVAAGLLAQATEEGQKVARNGGRTWRNVYRRLTQPRAIEHNPERLSARR